MRKGGRGVVVGVSDSLDAGRARASEGGGRWTPGPLPSLASLSRSGGGRGPGGTGSWRPCLCQPHSSFTLEDVGRAPEDREVKDEDTSVPPGSRRSTDAGADPLPGIGSARDKPASLVPARHGRSGLARQPHSRRRSASGPEVEEEGVGGGRRRVVNLSWVVRGGP